MRIQKKPSASTCRFVNVSSQTRAAHDALTASVRRAAAGHPGALACQRSEIDNMRVQFTNSGNAINGIFVKIFIRQKTNVAL